MKWSETANVVLWFLVFVAFPMLVIAFATYWAVVLFLAGVAALHYYVSMIAAVDPDVARENAERDGEIRVGAVLWMAFAMTLVIRLLKEYL
jgi:hypothetical protein